MSTDDKTEHQDEQEKVASVADAEPTTGVEIDQAAERKRGNAAPWRRVRLAPVVLVLLLVVSGGLAAWLYFSHYRTDEQTDPAAKQSAVDAARDGTVALLSYKPDTLDQDFAAAKSHLTGDFLNYYNQFTQDIVTPAAKEKALATKAQVVGAAVSELHPNTAVVLVFVDQSTTSKDRPDPTMMSSSVLVSLTKVQGKWLITKFDPV